MPEWKLRIILEFIQNKALIPVSYKGQIWCPAAEPHWQIRNLNALLWGKMRYFALTATVKPANIMVQKSDMEKAFIAAGKDEIIAATEKLIKRDATEVKKTTAK